VTRRPIIHNRRFYWLYADGRREPVRATEQLIQQMRQSSLQLRAAQRAVEADAPPRRTTHPPRPPGTKPMLPPTNRNHDGLTLAELAHQYGWGSVYRFSEALRKSRRSIYDAARAASRERSNANLMPPPQSNL
jgi:hypothetical protein